MADVPISNYFRMCYHLPG